MRVVSNNGSGKLVVLLTVVAMLFTLFMFAPNDASAATTSLTITKYASDKTTVLDQRTVTYQELRDGQLSDGTPIPIMGDGSTHYYHQGPVFIDDPDPETQELLRWNEAEDRNWDNKDMGAVKGTNVKDLCELVGGMAEGDTLQIKASDGFKKEYAYKNVYQYSDREGPMVVCWYKDGKYPDSGYTDGMRLVWFAEATYKEGPTDVIGLPSGYYNVFGNWDWRLAAESKYWYYYNNQYPTTTGLSVQNVNALVIYSTQAPKATWYVDDSGEADFTTIQAAVTAANAGDTIIVKDGTYTENVVVDKSLVIKSENGSAQTIVQAAEPNADVIKVTATNVTIEGFTVTGATSMGKSGIYLAGQSSGSCTIKNNLSTGNNQGIAVASSGNTVSNNTCTLSGRYGLYLSNATGNLITDNTCSNNTEGSGFALYLADNADNNTVSGNVADSNKIGIRVKAADSNIIFENTSSNNEYGLELATGSTGNVFYLNNFTGNTIDQKAWNFNAVAGNIWSSQEEQTYEFNGTQYTGYVGNYWSDYDGADADGNGIGDTPYQTVLTDTDNYPLMGLYQDGVIEGSGPAVDILYEGTVALAPGETFSVTAYNSGTAYDVSETTPLGALQAAATAGGFIYEVTDKNYENSGALLLDNVGDYHFVKGGSKWLAYVNGDYKDGYNNPAGALNLIELVDGDRVEFYYGDSASTDYNAVKAAATAAVKTVVSLAPAMDVLYDGEVALAPGETFSVTAYNSGKAYTVKKNTPLGALQAAATAAGFTYDVTDKNIENSGALLLDNIGDYPYVKGGSQWRAYVNGEYKDGYNNPAGALNLIELVEGDKVEFYYAAGISDPADLDAVKAAATAAVKTVAVTGVAPTDWTLQLTGARQEIVTKAYFEEGLDCRPSHRVSWTDDDGNVWGGMPLWLLVGMVDDDPDGAGHFSFNDELAAQNYEVNVIAGDGWKATLDSAAIARNDGYIIANTLNGEPLPLQTDGGKGCWPLHLKGSAVFGGQQVGNIVKIELSGLPQPPAGWTLEMLGKIGDTITQKEFEEGLACTGSGHYKEWTDNEGNVWSGVPLWVLLGVVDDLEISGHWTFNDSLAAGYSVKVTAEDGYARSFNGADVARSDDYIIANKCNGAPLTEAAPLRLVGTGVAKEDGSLSGASIGKIARIEIPELQTPPADPGSWNLTLKGKISQVITQAEFEEALACPRSGHYTEWTDGDGNVWSGMPLWFLVGRVDDRLPSSFDTNLASVGYTVLVKAGDGYTKDFASTDVARNNNYIIANKYNGEPLTDSWPLRLVGAGVAKEDGSLSGTSVGNVTEIELTSFNPVQPAPAVRIVKYAEDHITIIDEITVDYRWMENDSGFDVIGDGTTLYRYEGITNNPDDVWDADETYPGGFKIANAVKGTRIRDLCDLVGGMGAGTDITFVAKDGFETTLPYSCIYTDPSVQARQGDAILAWWGDGKYVPDYADGMRLFFTPDDHIYGQWDMHETIPPKYWHYYYSDGVQYPSCAGLSPKWITEIRIYSVPQGDWTLKLDGLDIGGMDYDVTKTYFEQALVCQFGANHKATYTDSEGQVWEGMPLWFLAGFVDDADQHSDNAFNNELALAGYQVVITAADGHKVTIDSRDIIRNNDYIVANTLNGALIPESDENWPLRLVGPAVSGETSISKIVSIKLVSSEQGKPVYTVTPEADAAYTAEKTSEGINFMTVNDGVSGFKYFTVGITPVTSHDGNETAVFTHLRNGSQLELNATRADFDQVGTAQAGFNVKAGDVVKVYLVDELTNAIDHNPVILQ
ncbi:MAG: NosD domain-containing protein [Pelotomaculaceae bacterium]